MRFEEDAEPVRMVLKKYRMSNPIVYVPLGITVILLLVLLYIMYRKRDNARLRHMLREVRNPIEERPTYGKKKARRLELKEQRRVLREQLAERRRLEMIDQIMDDSKMTKEEREEQRLEDERIQKKRALETQYRKEQLLWEQQEQDRLEKLSELLLDMMLQQEQLDLQEAKDVLSTTIQETVALAQQLIQQEQHGVISGHMFFRLLPDDIDRYLKRVRTHGFVSFSTMSSKQVEVYVRIRPHKSVKCVKSTGDTVHISNPRNSQEQINYTFTKVFSDQSKQENIFEHIRPQLDTIFQGTNVTLFAYGQTGSGKTHTINGSAKEPGMIPRTIGFLLAEIKQRKLDCKIAASYLEIYNEKIYDLLDASERTQSSHLDLRETQNKQIVVAGITVVPIHSIADFKRHHEAAMERRSTASTQLNEQSSRSHFIMQVHVTTKTDGKMCHSKLHMIDLAGSEDNKRTGNAGARMVESGAINKSLFVLGQVVESLNKNASRIPYRDSKITRFLQDSLGGSAIGMMIACLSPDEEHFIDTYNTLNFATKACNIKNTIQVNEMQEKTVEDRKQALQEWKSRKPGNDLKRRRSQETDKQLDEGKRLSDPKRLSDTQPAKRLSERNSLDERNDDKPRALKRFFTSGKSIEDQINEKVEQRLQQRLEEFKGTLFSPLRKDQSNFQNRLLEIEKRLEQKMKRALEDESQKENQQLEHIKENTRLRMLQIINTGSLKDLQQLKMIGKKRAQDIFEARQSFGEMSALEDLTRAGLSMHLIESIFKANIQL